MPPKAAKATSAHPSYEDMIKEAITSLKDRQGSSRPALKKFLSQKYKIVDNKMNTSHFNTALKRGEEKGVFKFPKGPSGRVKLGEGKAAKAPAKTATKAKAPAAKKAASAKKPVKKTTTAKKPAAKKAAAKPAAKKAAPKKAAAKPAAKKAAVPKKTAPAASKVTKRAAPTKRGPPTKRAAPSATKKASSRAAKK